MATIDDLLMAVSKLDAATAGTGGVTHTLLQSVVTNMAATVAALSGVTTAIQAIPGGGGSGVGGNTPPAPPPQP